jgi:hypothetical protein
MGELWSASLDYFGAKIGKCRLIFTRRPAGFQRRAGKCAHSIAPINQEAAPLARTDLLSMPKTGKFVFEYLITR